MSHFHLGKVNDRSNFYFFVSSVFTLREDSYLYWEMSNFVFLPTGLYCFLWCQKELALRSTTRKEKVIITFLFSLQLKLAFKDKYGHSTLFVLFKLTWSILVWALKLFFMSLKKITAFVCMYCFLRKWYVQCLKARAWEPEYMHFKPKFAYCQLYYLFR